MEAGNPQASSEGMKVCPSAEIKARNLLNKMRAQPTRSSSIFLVSAIALAGLRPLGQALAQVMIVRQRRDPNLALQILDRRGAGEAVAPVHVHRAGAANPLAAGAAKGEGGILLGLDLDQRIEDHRPAAVEIDVERVVAWILAGFGI